MATETEPLLTAPMSAAMMPEYLRALAAMCSRRDEIASNGGWQWSAGTGADAAPYFRIRNPWTRSLRFDPNGDHIREWVPELRDLPPGRLHVPLAAELQLAKDYPSPMLDHSAEQ